MAHTVVNLDRMSGTEDSSQLLSVRFYDGNDDYADLDNGAIVKLGDLESRTVNGTTVYEREIRKATTPAGTESLSELALVANPELIYDESVRHPLGDYYNKAGEAIRAYRFHQNDGFSMTADGFSGSPARGKVVVLGASTKPTVKDSAGSGDVVIGKIDDVFTLQGYTYYYVVVNL